MRGVHLYTLFSKKSRAEIILDALLNLTKYSGNPVFTHADGADAVWDRRFVSSPFLCFNKDGTIYKDANNKYLMYYNASNNKTSGHPTTPQRYDDRVGLAKSVNFIDWTRVTGLSENGDGCVITYGNGDRGDGIGHVGGTPSSNEGFNDGRFDQHDVQIGTIIYDPDDSLFKCWFTGNDNYSSDNLKFGYATCPRSEKGEKWTKQSNHILAYGSGDDNDGIYCPNVIWDQDDEKWKMWYIGKKTDGKFRLMYATSPDETSWTRYSANAVFEDYPTVSGMVSPFVIKIGGLYKPPIFITKGETIPETVG